jgi:hypothetical protein
LGGGFRVKTGFLREKDDPHGREIEQIKVTIAGRAFMEHEDIPMKGQEMMNKGKEKREFDGKKTYVQ